MKKLEAKNIIRGCPPTSSSSDVCSLDLELSGLRDGQLHRPAGKMLSLACSFDGETAYIIFDEDEVQEFLNRIEGATWIFHNSVFDIGHLRRWAKIEERKSMRDTMLIERLMFPNYYDDFKLNDLVRRYLGCYMEKETRKDFASLDGVMTPKQIEYAALDVLGTWLVDKEQQKIIDETDQLIWKNLYNPHVWTTLELGGFKLDVDAWTALAERNQAIVDDVEERLGKKYGQLVDHTTYSKRRPSVKYFYNPETRQEELSEKDQLKMDAYYASKIKRKEFVPFNPSSPAQVLKILNDNGVDVDSTGDDVIRHLYAESDLVKDVLDYRKAEKQVSTYGLKFLQNVEADDRIYTSLNIAKAETGRDCVHGDTVLSVKLSSPYAFAEVRDITIKDVNLSDGNVYETKTHAGHWCRIVKMFYKGSDEMYQVTLRNGDYIKCTIGHVFQGNPVWQHLYELGIGSEVTTPTGLSAICDISPIGVQDVWDIEVENDHSYVAQGFINHNSSSSPNLQNQPTDPERRACFIAGEGRKLVLYDYSGQEANLFAFITKDPILAEIVNSGKKLYIEVARLAFSEDVKKGSERYGIIKALVLGLMYGLTPYGFARDNGVDKDTAIEMFNKFFTAFPVAAQWVKDRQAKNAGVTRTIIGRKCHLHPYDYQWKNNSLNNPMQGSGSDMIKMAMKKFRHTDFYKKYHPENLVNLILQVHDEIIVECAESVASECSEVLKSTMIEVAETLHPGIVGGVSGGIIDNWSQKG